MARLLPNAKQAMTIFGQNDLTPAFIYQLDLFSKGERNAMPFGFSEVQQFLDKGRWAQSRLPTTLVENWFGTRENAIKVKATGISAKEYARVVVATMNAKRAMEHVLAPKPKSHTIKKPKQEEEVRKCTRCGKLDDNQTVFFMVIGEKTKERLCYNCVDKREDEQEQEEDEQEQEKEEKAKEKEETQTEFGSGLSTRTLAQLVPFANGKQFPYLCSFSLVHEFLSRGTPLTLNAAKEWFGDQETAMRVKATGISSADFARLLMETFNAKRAVEHVLSPQAKRNTIKKQNKDEVKKCSQCGKIEDKDDEDGFMFNNKTKERLCYACVGTRWGRDDDILFPSEEVTDDEEDKEDKGPAMPVSAQNWARNTWGRDASKGTQQVAEETDDDDEEEETEAHPVLAQVETKDETMETRMKSLEEHMLKWTCDVEIRLEDLTRQSNNDHEIIGRLQTDIAIAMFTQQRKLENEKEQLVKKCEALEREKNKIAHDLFRERERNENIEHEKDPITQELFREKKKYTMLLPNSANAHIDQVLKEAAQLKNNRIGQARQK